MCKKFLLLLLVIPTWMEIWRFGRKERKHIMAKNILLLLLVVKSYIGYERSFKLFISHSDEFFSLTHSLSLADTKIPKFY